MRPTASSSMSPKSLAEIPRWTPHWPPTAEVRLDAADVRALAIGAVFVVARAVLIKRAIRLIHETRGLAEGVERAADGVRAVEHRALAFHQFDAVDREGIDGVPVLDRAAAPGGVVEAHAIDHQQVLAAGEAADEGRAMAVRGFLNQHAGRVLERLRQRAAGVFTDEIRIDARWMWAAALSACSSREAVTNNGARKSWRWPVKSWQVRSSGVDFHECLIEQDRRRRGVNRAEMDRYCPAEMPRWVNVFDHSGFVALEQAAAAQFLAQGGAVDAECGGQAGGPLVVKLPAGAAA
jgi:hypothetical protein